MTNLLTRFEKLPLLDRVFDVSITLKRLDGDLELIGGVLLFFLTQDRLNAIMAFLTQHELSEDPKDFLATPCGVVRAQPLRLNVAVSSLLSPQPWHHQDHLGGGPA
jgi:uncharacterized membrane protein